MSGRSIAAGVTSAIAASHIEAFPLVDMALDSGTLYLCGAAVDVSYGGNTYLSAYGVGSVEPIEETDAGVMGLAFTLSHVPSSSLSLALGTEVQGRAVTLRMAFLDSSGTLNVDTNVWTGYLDQMVIADDSPNGQIRVTAEHKLIRWDIPRPWRFSDEDQRIVNSTDGFFKNAASIAEATITWPAKEFYRQ